MTEYRIIAPDGIRKCGVFTLHEVKYTTAEEVAFRWYVAGHVPTTHGEPTGRVWRLKNKSGTQLSHLLVQTCTMAHALSSPSLFTQCMTNPIAVDGVLKTFFIWPAVKDQSMLDAAWQALSRVLLLLFVAEGVAGLLECNELPRECPCGASVASEEPAFTTHPIFALLPEKHMLFLRLAIRVACPSMRCRAETLRDAARLSRATAAEATLIYVTRRRTCDHCASEETTSATVPKYKVCSRCWVTHYCSRECQIADWQEHEPLCAYIIETDEDRGE
jgi:hypothetical protein